MPSSIDWNSLYPELAKLANGKRSYDEYVECVLENLCKIAGCERITYLTCIYQARHSAHLVTGLTYPINKTIVPYLSTKEGFTVLSQNVVLDDQVERLLTQFVDTEDCRRLVALHQVRFPQNDAQHYLCLRLTARTQKFKN
ncbi:MAG: hypothetical protein C4B58_06910 [Deltaproteobacteria bacterium]|nr:MAG: hypothetical protein C4B58_06910 [Deltaproteobacteria bacterium]